MIEIQHDEWLYVTGSQSAEAAARFFGLTLEDAIVEPDGVFIDDRGATHPKWRVKARNER